MVKIPYKATRMLLKIDGTAIDVVEGANIELEKEGGIEGYYGSQTGKHSVGLKKGTFSIRRWLRDNDDPDLLYELFNAELPFSLSGEIDDVSSSTLTLSDCQLYRYRWILGGVGDVIAEESSGECVDWSSTL